MVLLSPEHPDPKIGAAHSMGVLHHELAEKMFIPNLPALDWLLDLFAQMNMRGERYYERELPFGTTPTLILFGGKDTEVSETARRTYREYAERTREAGHDTVVFHVLPEAEHDVFAKNGRTDATAVEAYNLFYWFLKHHVLRDPTAVRPVSR
jgi:alpha-beta hydrolase superfamily lysophospholipase